MPWWAKLSCASVCWSHSASGCTCSHLRQAARCYQSWPAFLGRNNMLSRIRIILFSYSNITRCFIRAWKKQFQGLWGIELISGKWSSGWTSAVLNCRDRNKEWNSEADYNHLMPAHLILCLSSSWMRWAQTNGWSFHLVLIRWMDISTVLPLRNNNVLIIIIQMPMNFRENTFSLYMSCMFTKSHERSC